jgi:hypothetical protein
MYLFAQVNTETSTILLGSFDAFRQASIDLVYVPRRGDQLSELIVELVRLSRDIITRVSAVAVRAVMQLTAHSHSFSRL